MDVRADPATTDRLDLYWIPLGSGPGLGSAVVRLTGAGYSLARGPAGRPRASVFHVAALAWRNARPWTIEMGPAWGANAGSNSVAATGAVGWRFLGRWRAFRYEVRCGPGSTIPDLAYAVGPAETVARGSAVVRRVLALAPRVPTATWGRDELGTGQMWNSNAMISWLLVAGGVDVSRVAAPPGGIAPGWQAGVRAARRGVRGGPTWT